MKLQFRDVGITALKIFLILVVATFYLGLSGNGDVALLIIFLGIYLEFRVVGSLNKLWELANE